MKFLIDNQLPLQLAEHLRHRGHDCLHVLELELDEANDAAIWSCAERDERIVVSKDDDFIFLANRKLSPVKPPTCVCPAIPLSPGCMTRHAGV
ncbi:MAG: DUF5615 family PIN-like protein [Phycisphaeraceae bacterium]